MRALLAVVPAFTVGHAQQFGELIRSEMVRWAKVVKDSGAKSA